MAYRKLLLLVFLLFLNSCTKQAHTIKEIFNPRILKLYVDPNCEFQIGYYDTLYSGEILINGFLEKN